MLCGAYYQQMGGIERTQEEKKKMREEADRIINKVKESLSQDGGISVKDCGDGTCIDLYIQFPLNEDAIKDADREALHQACEIIKKALDELGTEQRKNIEVVIEGHTDNQPVARLSDPKGDFIFNWNLSSRRATSVLYEFSKCGLRPPDYRVEAIGYADSKPICTEQTPQCYDTNRRTTLRLRADTISIERALQ